MGSMITASLPSMGHPQRQSQSLEHCWRGLTRLTHKRSSIRGSCTPQQVDTHGYGMGDLRRDWLAGIRTPASPASVHQFILAPKTPEQLGREELRKRRRASTLDR